MKKSIGILVVLFFIQCTYKKAFSKKKIHYKIVWNQSMAVALSSFVYRHFQGSPFSKGIVGSLPFAFLLNQSLSMQLFSILLTRYTYYKFFLSTHYLTRFLFWMICSIHITFCAFVYPETLDDGYLSSLMFLTSCTKKFKNYSRHVVLTQAKALRYLCRHPQHPLNGDIYESCQPDTQELLKRCQNTYDEPCLAALSSVADVIPKGSKHHRLFCAFLHPQYTDCTEGFRDMIYSTMEQSCKIYIPLNLALVSACKSITMMTFFISMYSLLICNFRNVFGKEAMWHYAFTGCLVSPFILLEDPRRMLDLILFCIPKVFYSLKELTLLEWPSCRKEYQLELAHGLGLAWIMGHFSKLASKKQGISGMYQKIFELLYS